MRAIINIVAYGLLMLLVSCKSGFEPIDYGSDACMHCKMIIIDKRFAAEMLTSKGKAFKFDDVHCMKLYMNEHAEEASKAEFFVAAYLNSKPDYLDAVNAVYLTSESFKSPMNGNAAAFATAAEARRYSDSLQLNINYTNWQGLQ